MISLLTFLLEFLAQPETWTHLLWKTFGVIWTVVDKKSSSRRLPSESENVL